MARLGFRIRGLGGALLLALLASASPARADDAIPEEAKLYFKNGVELIQGQSPNYQDAYYQFKLAWEKSKSWKVLSNWGLCALKLERDGEAIWAYTEYLKQKDIDPDERKELERDLLLLNGNAVDGKGFALFTQGKGFVDWGAGLGMTFSNGPAMKACVYDASIHVGIRFRTFGKVSGPDPYLHIHVVTTDVADREHSGTCDAVNEKCYDNFNFDVRLPGVGVWEEHAVPFTDFKQAGWGAPKKFYPNHLLNLEFVTGPGAEFEFGIDQVEFY